MRIDDLYKAIEIILSSIRVRSPQKIKIAGECIVWCGGKSGNGYGYLGVVVGKKRKTTRVHRYTYEKYLNKKIPEKMYIDHICRNKLCINPFHLRIVTPRINSIENSIGPSAINYKKTVCGICGGQYIKVKNYGWGIFRKCPVCTRRSDRLNHIKYRELKKRTKDAT